ARQQFFGYVVFLGAHCAYGQAGLRRRLIVRLHKILHTLPSKEAVLEEVRFQREDAEMADLDPHGLREASGYVFEPPRVSRRPIGLS
ncbi:MAG: hypothetical protein LBV05_07295, partial [Comamonas sp.]|uniref:hypothetical protein n=1 Tax=Comamonas sp. TaxID=34028 RepID=UPI002840631D